MYMHLLVVGMFMYSTRTSMFSPRGVSLYQVQVNLHCKTHGRVCIVHAQTMRSYEETQAKKAKKKRILYEVCKLHAKQGWLSEVYLSVLSHCLSCFGMV